MSADPLPPGASVIRHTTGGGVVAYAWRYGPAVRLGYGSPESAERGLRAHVATHGGTGKAERCGGCQRPAMLTVHGACADCHAKWWHMCGCGFCTGTPEQGNRGPQDPGACQPGDGRAVAEPRARLSGSGSGVLRHG